MAYQQQRSGSPTPIFDSFASRSRLSFPPSAVDDDDADAASTKPLNPADYSASGDQNNPYRRAPQPAVMPVSPSHPGGAKRHPLSNLLTPSSSTPTLATEQDAESGYDDGKERTSSAPLYAQQVGSSTPYLASSSVEDEKHFSNVQQVNSTGGLLAWLAEDEKRRSSSGGAGGDDGEGYIGAAGVSGEDGHRVGYIDGLKFLAGLIAMNATFLAVTQEEPGAVELSSPLYVVRSANIAAQALLLLSGRSLPIPLPHASPLLSLSLIARPIRFVPPVIVVLLLQWGLCAGGHTDIIGQVLGISNPSWCGIQNAAGFFTLLWGLFGTFSYNTTVGQAFGANTWTVPWFFQSSYFTYLLHIVVSALPSNRYWIYIVLFCFTWSTFSYFTPALLGYVIYDMSTMFLPRIRRMPLVQRMLVQALLLGLIILFEFVIPTRNAINSGMAAWNVRNVTEIQFGDTVFVSLLLLWVEITPWAQLVLGNVLVRYLFLLTPGLYLLTPSLSFTLVPAVMSHFPNSFNNAGGLFAAWIALVATVVPLSLVFYFVVVYPSIYLSRVLCSFLVSWGPDADPDSFAHPGAAPAMTEGKHRRIYVEKPFRSFSLVTSAFGTPIGTPAPSVRRMRMDHSETPPRASRESIRHSRLSQSVSEATPLSPRIEMTPLSSPEGTTPHGSSEELPFQHQQQSNRVISPSNLRKSFSEGRVSSNGGGKSREYLDTGASNGRTYSNSSDGHSSATYASRQVSPQQPGQAYHVPPPLPPKGAALPLPPQGPYYHQ